MDEVGGGRDRRRVPCVGAIVRDDRGRLLLVQRGNQPGRGQWSIPGGRVEPGESARAAVVREVLEETGLHVVPTGVAGVVEREAPDGSVYVIEDFFAEVPGGRVCADLRAGDDAAAAGWFAVSELDQVDCVAGLVDALRTWEVVPTRS